MEKLTVDKFDGGIADNYLSTTANRYAQADNLHLDENGKPFTRWGTFAYPARVPGSTLTSRVSGLYVDSEPYGRPIAFSVNKAYLANSSDAWTEITGPASNAACPNKTSSDIESLTIWRKQLIYASAPSTVLPHRIYCSTLDTTYTALTLGLPALATAPVCTKGGTTSSQTYIYTFHYFYQFTDYEGTVFEEKGPITTVEVTDATEPSSSNVAITAIPVLANTASTNYDVSTSLKVRIYRTIKNGTTSYLLATVNNGTTVYTDSTSDATIQLNTVVYTDGDVLDYNPPPTGSFFVTQVGGYFWYATERILTHSIRNAPGACPDEYYEPTAQKIKGLASVNSFPILFCDRSVYRVEGAYDEFGDGGFDLNEISQTAGCYSHKSIVEIPDGLVWAGNGGFYFTDGSRVQKLSVTIDERYKTWRSSSIAGVYDALRNCVVWTISSSANSNTHPCDSFAVLHLNFGLNIASTFTTYSSERNIFPTALSYSQSEDVDEEYRGKLLIGDGRGYVLYQDPLAYTDPLINTDLYPTAFSKKAIIYRYESMGTDMGDPSALDYCTELTAEFKNETDLAAQFFSRRDDGGPYASLSEIRADGAIIWGISEYPWDGDDDDVDHDWNSQDVISAKRHFPNGTLRSTRRQVALTNALTYISKSDDLGLATTDTTAKTVTLNDATQFWPGDCEGYEVGFDALATGTYTYYLVKTRDSDTQITVYDPYATLPSGSTLKWQLRGYRKFERMHLLSYTIWFDNEGAVQVPNRGTAGYVNV